MPILPLEMAGFWKSISVKNPHKLKQIRLVRSVCQESEGEPEPVQEQQHHHEPKSSETLGAKLLGAAIVGHGFIDPFRSEVPLDLWELWSKDTKVAPAGTELRCKDKRSLPWDRHQPPHETIAACDLNPFFLHSRYSRNF